MCKDIMSEYNLPKPLLKFDSCVPIHWRSISNMSGGDNCYNCVYLGSFPLFIYLLPLNFNLGFNLSACNGLLRISYTPHFLYLFKWIVDLKKFGNIVYRSFTNDSSILEDLCSFLANDCDHIGMKYKLK